VHDLSLLANHRSNPSIITIIPAINNKIKQSDFSPSKAGHENQMVNEYTGKYNLCDIVGIKKYASIKSHVNSALDKFKHRKSSSGYTAQKSSANKYKPHKAIKDMSRSNKGLSLRYEPNTATAKISRDMMLNEMSRHLDKSINDRSKYK
jgi:hypothetical protein